MPEKATTPAGADGARQDITKVEAVRRALVELGRDATPTQIQKFVKERFGLDMTTMHTSSAKVKILRQQAGKTTAAKKPAANKGEPKQEARQPQGQQPHLAKAASLPLDDILTLKELVRRHGAEPLRVLINAFAK